MAKEEKAASVAAVAAVTGLKVQDAQLLCDRADALGLDPLSGQIHLLRRPSFDSATNKYVDNVSFQVGIEGFRLIAERSGKYDGQDPIIFVVMRNGKEVRTDVVLDKDEPVAAIAAVYKKGISRPFVAVAHFKDYAGRKKDGSLTAMWKKMTIMLPKCAEAAAFRKGFPDLGLGLTYEPAELANCDEPDNNKPLQTYKVPETNHDVKWVVEPEPPVSNVIAGTDVKDQNEQPPVEASVSAPAPVVESAPVADAPAPVAEPLLEESPASDPVADAQDTPKEPATETQKTAILRLAKAKGLSFDPIALEDLSKDAAAKMIKDFNLMKKAA
ncbi:MAG TPA: recombinase RecT [Candidatus Omnitrophota bacterium]|nr:recombinase RecT [Candidatus Omnitrophota bacterium]